MKIYDSIIKSITTEKSSTQQSEHGKYTFLVRKDVTKVDVQNAIQGIYGVEVENVRMMITPKKTRTAGRHIMTKRPVHKKAIVKIKGGKTLDLHKFKEAKTK